MKVYENFDKIRYTKIEVPITLRKCPSDYESNESYFDVDIDWFCQQKCYVGKQLIEKIQIQRIMASNNISEINEAKWKLEIIVSEYKNEDEAILIIDNLCKILSLHYAMEYRYFQYNGFSGFSFLEMDVKRYYSEDDYQFGEADLNRCCGIVEIKKVAKIRENIFQLPPSKTTFSKLFEDLSSAFINALNSGDAVSRFILLYHLFEIIYATPEYQKLKSCYESVAKKERGDKKRSKILFQYLHGLYSVGLPSFSSR